MKAPLSFAEMPTGLLLMADGLNPMTRWDGFLFQPQAAGIAAPLTAPTLSSAQNSGNYFAYCRFLDASGNPSNLSPVSNLLAPGGYGSIGSVTALAADPGGSGQVKVTSANPHGLLSNDQVTMSGFGFVSANTLIGTWYVTVVDATNFLLQSSNASLLGILNNPANYSFVLSGLGASQVGISTNQVSRTNHGLINGETIKVTALVNGALGAGITLPAAFTVTVLDPNSFTITGFSATGTPSFRVTFLPTANAFSYTGVPVPTDPKVVRRQLLRNTDGQTTTFYIDVDTNDIVSTIFSSTLTDSQLQANTAVPLLRPDGSLGANRYNVPPAHKACLASHLGRMFAAVEVAYSAGNIQVTNGQTTVTGIGTSWPSTFAGRFLYVRGASQPYQISSVNTTAQTLTLLTNYVDSTDAFALYAIRPAPAERRLVYYSEPGFPEAWPPTNALSLQEDADEITGLCQKGSFLYVLERRHTYRFTFQTDPAVDGFLFLVLQRGCINNRCWVNIEGVTYMLDEAGIHSFSGGNDTQPLSHVVQDLFRFSDSPYRINWAASQLFHCCHFPQQETVRWFVVMAGNYLPYHAIALNYREKRWWIEQYNRPIGCSTTGLLGGTPQVMLGTDAKTILAFWQGTLDGPDPKAGTVRGSVTKATLLSLTDQAANFAQVGLALPTAAGLIGNPVVIVAGKGKGQVRRVVAVSPQTLTIKDPWQILPDATSQYQLGGIVWQYRSGVFRYLEDEETTQRRLEVIFNPCVSGPCTTNLRLFENLSTLATVWSVSMDSGSGQGVQTQAGSADMVIDLTKANGFIQRRLDRHRDVFSDGTRFAAIELAGVTNQDPVSIFQLQLDGAFS